MKSSIACAKADKTGLYIAALHISFAVLFFVSLVLISVFAKPAYAADESCGAADLYASLAAKNPDMMAEVNGKAQGVTHGKGRLWQINKAGYAPSYVFGTMHLSDERVTNLPAPVQKAYDGADVVVIETTDILDPQKQMAFFTQNPDMLLLQDGKTIHDFLADDEETLVENLLAERGLALSSVATMQPWLYASAVTLPFCEFQRTKGGVPMLDQKLALDAVAASRDVRGLESMAEQVGAINSISVKDQMDSLVQMAKLGGDAGGIYESMTQLYLKGEIAAIMPMMAALSETLLPDEEAADQTDFEQIVVTKRNHTMVERASQMLAESNEAQFFIAVGALHLPGEEGVLALLEKAGFTPSLVMQ